MHTYCVVLRSQSLNSLKTLNVHFVARTQTGVQAQPQIRANEDPPTRSALPEQLSWL